MLGKTWSNAGTNTRKPSFWAWSIHATPWQGPPAPPWNTCPTKTTNSKAFEVDVTENATAYRIFHCSLYSVRQKPLQTAMFLACDVFNNMVAKNTAICEVLNFRAKNSSLSNVQKHCKNQCFCPTKTAKAVTWTAPKSQNLARPPDKTHGKHTCLKTENRRPKVKKHQKAHVFFSLFSCRFRAGACMN